MLRKEIDQAAAANDVGGEQNESEGGKKKRLFTFSGGSDRVGENDGNDEGEDGSYELCKKSIEDFL